MRGWYVLLVVAACGKDKPDCAKYASHYAEVGTAGSPGRESRRQSVEFVERESCDQGRVSATKASCVAAASTSDDLMRCEGLTPVAKSTTPPPPPPKRARVKRKGYSVAVPAGWTTKEAKLGDNELLMRGPNDPTGAFLTLVDKAPLGMDADACRSAAERMAKRTGATVKSSQIIQTKHGPACRTIHTDPKMVIQADSVAVGGGTMTVTCFYELTRTDPAPYCAEIVDSLAFE